MYKTISKKFIILSVVSLVVTEKKRTKNFLRKLLVYIFTN
jgi:hypothetical protein